jgi:hypothetical protein
MGTMQSGVPSWRISCAPAAKVSHLRRLDYRLWDVVARQDSAAKN